MTNLHRTSPRVMDVTPRKCRPRGIFLLDIGTALAMLGVLTGVLLLATAKRTRATRALVEQRMLLRRAEATLVGLQSGAKRAAPTATMPNDARDEPAINVDVQVVDSPIAPAGHRWVRVSAARDGRHVELFGVVASDAIAVGPLDGETRR